MSAKDRAQAAPGRSSPIPPRKTLVLGAGGQLGRALREAYADAPHVEFAERAELDLAVRRSRYARGPGATTTRSSMPRPTQRWMRPRPPRGVVAAWATNVTGVAALARVAAEHGITLVHISSDYVFDGTATRPYREDDPVAPLGVYGQTKAAGDQIVAHRAAPLHRAHVVGDRRRPKLRAHHAVSRRTRRRPVRGRRPVRTLDIHLGTGPSDPAPHRDTRAVRNVQRDGVPGR